MTAALDMLDETARQMEMTWGVGRLRLLVSEFLCLEQTLVRPAYRQGCASVATPHASAAAYSGRQ